MYLDFVLDLDLHVLSRPSFSDRHFAPYFIKVIFCLSIRKNCLQCSHATCLPCAKYSLQRAPNPLTPKLAEQTEWSQPRTELNNAGNKSWHKWSPAGGQIRPDEDASSFNRYSALIWWMLIPICVIFFPVECFQIFFFPQYYSTTSQFKKKQKKTAWQHLIWFMYWSKRVSDQSENLRRWRPTKTNMPLAKMPPRVQLEFTYSSWALSFH